MSELKTIDIPVYPEDLSKYVQSIFTPEEVCMLISQVASDLKRISISRNEKVRPESILISCLGKLLAAFPDAMKKEITEALRSEIKLDITIDRKIDRKRTHDSGFH
jgi:hypothetical protein